MGERKEYSMGTLSVDHGCPCPGPETPVVRVKTNVTHHFRVLSRSVFGIWIHWNGLRSEACFTEKKVCPGCTKGLPRRWKGYLHALATHLNGKDCFLELTPLAVTSILSQVPQGEILRGLRLEVRRTAGGEKGRLQVVVLGDINPGNGLIAERDPISVLSRLWGLERN